MRAFSFEDRRSSYVSPNASWNKGLENLKVPSEPQRVENVGWNYETNPRFENFSSDCETNPSQIPPIELVA